MLRRPHEEVIAGEVMQVNPRVIIIKRAHLHDALKKEVTKALKEHKAGKYPKRNYVISTHLSILLDKNYHKLRKLLKTHNQIELKPNGEIHIHKHE